MVFMCSSVQVAGVKGVASNDCGKQPHNTQLSIP